MTSTSSSSSPTTRKFSTVNIIDEFDRYLTENFAAIIITRFFREVYHTSKSYLKYHQFKTRKLSAEHYLPSHSLISRPIRNHGSTSLSSTHQQVRSSGSDYFQSLLYQTPSNPLMSFSSLPHSNTIHHSLQDKFQFWRNILELKRIHPNYPNEVLMKCLIECQGDLTKAIINIENVDFIYAQQLLLKDGHPIIQLTNNMKQLFLPFFERYQHLLEQYDFCLDGRIPPNPQTFDQFNTTTNISTIRSLRQHHGSRDPIPSEMVSSEEIESQRKLLLRKKELLSHFVDIIEKTYFPTASAVQAGHPSSTTPNKLKSSTKKIKLKT